MGTSSLYGWPSIAMFDVRLPDANHSTWFFQLTSVGGQVGIPSAAFPLQRGNEAAENVGVSKRRLGKKTEPDVFWSGMVRINPRDSPISWPISLLDPQMSYGWVSHLRPIVARSNGMKLERIFQRTSNLGLMWWQTLYNIDTDRGFQSVIKYHQIHFMSGQSYSMCKRASSLLFLVKNKCAFFLADFSFTASAQWLIQSCRHVGVQRVWVPGSGTWVLSSDTHLDPSIKVIWSFRHSHHLMVSCCRHDNANKNVKVTLSILRAM